MKLRLTAIAALAMSPVLVMADADVSIDGWSFDMDSNALYQEGRNYVDGTPNGGGTKSSGVSELTQTANGSRFTKSGFQTLNAGPIRGQMYQAPAASFSMLQTPGGKIVGIEKGINYDIVQPGDLPTEQSVLEKYKREFGGEPSCYVRDVAEWHFNAAGEILRNGDFVCSSETHMVQNMLMHNDGSFETDRLAQIYYGTRDMQGSDEVEVYDLLVQLFDVDSIVNP